MHVPYRRAKQSYALPVVTILALTTPFAVLGLSDSPDIRAMDESNLAAIPATLAEVGLASAPDIVLPLRELTGLDLPDLRLSDLRKLPLPASIRVPDALEAPLGMELPDEIPLPRLSQPGQPGATSPYGPSQNAPGFIADPEPIDETPAGAPQPAAPEITGDPRTPALAPGAVPHELASKVGPQVKELTRDTPFSMVALTAQDMAGTTALIRAKRPDGSWGPWFSAEPVDSPGRPGATRTGTEPIYVGNTKAVQILVTRKDTGAAPAAAPTTGSAPGEVPATAPIPRNDTAGDPAQVNLEKLAAILIDPGRGAADENLHQVAAALPGGGPKVITRSQWGADESIRCDEPTYDDGLSAITVHHTAGRNDYSRAESAGIVRAIFAYHAKTLGWCDIGYNALVDKYGQIFEGRFGGLDRPVEGAHAGGFNINTAGVAFMGNHESEEPSDAAVESMGEFIGWRAKVAGFDPEGSSTMYSEGSEFTRYALGQAVKLPNVFAHRDVGNTTCPGDAAYEVMDRIRDIAKSFAGPGPVTTTSPDNSRLRPEQNAGNQYPGNGYPQRPTTPNTDADLATLAELTTKLLGLLDRSPVARYWNEQGGPNSALGQPASEPQPTADGGQYAKFVNGYVYATPDGRVFAVVGKILERFLQLGAGTGILGLPLSNEYPVDDGVRADFQNGSLIFNRLTGIVTTVLKNFGAVQDPAASVLPEVLGTPPAQGDQIPATLPDPAPLPDQAPLPETPVAP
ncbi:N-acetylmuramoyl-L-alanine amidase [Nocardia sp. NPDC127526]|uniref:N-acetylmuramoyl-L-alanine amidase n=1 Tax=Nocardia sp. NPDC127526 TaxID=3345393 RepID=UPI00363CCA76